MVDDVVTRALARESIYQLIYSVIIWSAIARALGDGKDNHVNEIPNISIVASLVWEYRGHRIGSLPQSAFYKPCIHLRVRLFWIVCFDDNGTDSVAIIDDLHSLRENAELAEDRRAMTATWPQQRVKQTISKSLPETVGMPPNFLRWRKVKFMTGNKVVAKLSTFMIPNFRVTVITINRIESVLVA